MKRKLTQLSILLIALFSITTSFAQSGDFEFVFETDGDLEGFTSFGSPGAAPVVASGKLTFSYGGDTAGIELNPPSSTVYLEKAAFPYLAIKLSATPSTRRYMYLKTNGTGAWYKNKANPDVDAELDALNVFYYDISGDNFTTSALGDGAIDRLIFNLLDDTESTVSIEWIKTFASRAAIVTYANSALSTNNIEDVSKTTISTGKQTITINNCELNAKVEVYNLTGGLLKTEIAKSNSFSISIEKKGIYIVKVSSESSELTDKVIVY